MAFGENLMKIGQGFDIHRLEAGRPFLLAGVRIPSDRGPVGHSDGDALFHAVTDALLGAIAQGDIGQHFPDTNSAYEGQASSVFLTKALELVTKAGLRVANLDTTIILERPKLAEFIPAMRRQLAQTLSLELNQVSIKAKTHEKLDALGNEEGVAVHAVVLLV